MYLQETGTIELNGRSYTSGGATVLPGIIGGYVAGHDAGRVDTFPLTTWDGSFMFVLVRVTKRWTTYTKHGERMRWTSYRATIDGKDWIGRHCSDWSELLWLRPAKRT